MDKGKEQIVEVTDSDSSSGTDGSSEDVRKALEEQMGATDYWKKAYSDLYTRYSQYRAWAETQLAFIVAKDRAQFQNLKNMGTDNRHYFQRQLEGLAAQLNHISQQLGDAIYGTEWVGQEYMREAVIPRYEFMTQAEVPPTEGGSNPSLDASNIEGNLVDTVPPYVPNQTRVEDEAEPSSRPPKKRMTGREYKQLFCKQATRPPSPLQQTNEELDWAQMLFEMGDEDMLNVDIRDIQIDEVSLNRDVNGGGIGGVRDNNNNNDGAAGNNDNDDDGNEVEEEPEEDPEEEPEEDPMEDPDD